MQYLFPLISIDVEMHILESPSGGGMLQFDINPSILVQAIPTAEGDYKAS